jgi:D-3-phosphoglycerate dehydrogenase / 2-oxoglutarate reductase
VTEVFLVQPIHAAGVDRLRGAGLAVRQGSAADMATVAAEIGPAQVVVTRNAGLSAVAIDAAPGLRLIVVHGVGHDRVDVARAAARGIVVCNTPADNARSVAEHALALMLALARQLRPADLLVRTGRFETRYGLRVEDLRGKTLGIVGCGRVGLETAALARAAFRMRVLGFSPSADPAALARRRIEPCPDLGRLLDQADVVSIHARLRPETRGLIGRAELARMRPGAWLVNTARGALVDESALVDALASRRIAGAALDVFATEPVPAGHPLLALDNVLLSPHIAGSSEQALAATAAQVARVILGFLRGRTPPNLIR